MKFTRAFTLAEVLITLTIIGIIAAITIPTLYSKYQKHTYVVGLKKAYSQLQNAVKMIPIAENCPAGDYDCAGMGPESNDMKNMNKKADLFAKQIKTRQICYVSDNSCQLEGFTSRALIYSQDGMVYIFYPTNIYIDVNGKKGPNKLGRDRFAFLMAKETKNGISYGTIMPYGSQIYAKYIDVPGAHWSTVHGGCTIENINTNNNMAVYCTARVLEEDAMNY